MGKWLEDDTKETLGAWAKIGTFLGGVSGVIVAQYMGVAAGTEGLLWAGATFGAVGGGVFALGATGYLCYKGYQKIKEVAHRKSLEREMKRQQKAKDNEKEKKKKRLMSDDTRETLGIWAKCGAFLGGIAGVTVAQYMGVAAGTAGLIAGGTAFAAVGGGVFALGAIGTLCYKGYKKIKAMRENSKAEKNKNLKSLVKEKFSKLWEDAKYDCKSITKSWLAIGSCLGGVAGVTAAQYLSFGATAGVGLSALATCVGVGAGAGLVIGAGYSAYKYIKTKREAKKQVIYQLAQINTNQRSVEDVARVKYKLNKNKEVVVKPKDPNKKLLNRRRVSATKRLSDMKARVLNLTFR